MLVAGKALPQLVQCTIFQLDYASLLLRVVILRALGIIYRDDMDVLTWYFSQPICAIHVPS